MTRVAIIGAGFSGLAAAIELLDAGHQVTVFERAEEVGGVWRQNTYPGAACDVPSAYYSYSFEPNPRWSRRYAPQSEILGYLRRASATHDVRQHIRFGTTIDSATFDPDTNQWRLTSADGAEYHADVFIPAVGQLSQPSYPAIAGRDSFGGNAFHSAQWNHDVDLTGKRVAVIGTGASAIQLIPEIAPTVKSLAVFQRSAPHIVPRPDSRMTRLHHALAARVPVTLRTQRWTWQALTEAYNGVLHYSPTLSRGATALTRAFMRFQTRGEAGLFEKVWPDYPIGCKRVLFSNAYLPTLRQPHVELITDAITGIEPDGLRTVNGLHTVDIIIYGTGFTANGFLDHVAITGLDGESLRDRWAAGARAYLGMTVPGYPNMFVMYGPNTNLGSGSIVAMLECQARYIRGAVDAMTPGHAFDVRDDVEEQYDDGLQQCLASGIWSGCDSWYVAAGGRVTTNWPGLVREYRARTARFTMSDYRAIRPAPTGPAPTAQVDRAGVR